MEVKAENIKPYHQLLDTLISKKQWQQAQQLAQRMLVFADDSMKKEIYWKQGSILMEQDMAYEAYEIYRKIYELPLSSDIEKSKTLIYSALCFVQMEEYGTALHFLTAYPIDNTYLKTKFLISGYCQYNLKEYELAKENFWNAGFDNYEILFKKDLKELETLKVISTISSVILPGSGQMMLGKPLKGASALTINVALGMLAIRVASVSFLDAILFTTPLFMRYYIGNIARTSHFADEKIKKLKRNNILKVTIQV